MNTNELSRDKKNSDNIDKLFRFILDDNIATFLFFYIVGVATCFVSYVFLYSHLFSQTTNLDQFLNLLQIDPTGSTKRILENLDLRIFLDSLISLFFYIFVKSFLFHNCEGALKLWLKRTIWISISIILFYENKENRLVQLKFYIVLILFYLCIEWLRFILNNSNIKHKYGKVGLSITIGLVLIFASGFFFKETLAEDKQISSNIVDIICKDLRLASVHLKNDEILTGFVVFDDKDFLFTTIKNSRGKYNPTKIKDSEILKISFMDVYQFGELDERNEAFQKCSK